MLIRRAVLALVIVTILVVGVALVAVNRPPDHPPHPGKHAVLIRRPLANNSIESAAHSEQVRRMLLTAMLTPTTTTTTTQPARVREQGPSAAGEFAPAGFLACVLKRESEGQYGVSDGSGNYGGFQFSVGTWNSTAAHAGRGDLVGVNPADASPADQNAMAEHLLSWQGTDPWKGGRYPC